MEEQSKANANIEKLNSEQRYAVYKVLHAVYEYQTDMPKCFFLDGPAGKTFVYSTLLHAIRGKGDQAIAVASTGMHIYKPYPDRTEAGNQPISLATRGSDVVLSSRT
ncbi:hypothetical protein AVEN_271720-1 [Araneus ventricosus]|uniref:ATP-dependent DNA helicase n=1 Tax=Araneus ventricosus TaxID=182803 RepID=A0A4Y2P3A7_ARAVE|nr:hypothetical protein AVEN_271720-1 [Araneus ventricosus]